MIKHFFIINPSAGKGGKSLSLSEAIKDACEVTKSEYEIHFTKEPLEATKYVREKIKEKPDNAIWRFYACGGDGTLSEVVNGAVNEAAGESAGPIKGVEVGCMPIGTGNDFVRNFTSPEFFLDVTKQLLADSTDIDCYMCGNGRYGINMINIGFDCDTVVKASEFKRNPLVPRGFAYIFGVAATLIKNHGCHTKVIWDDKEEGTKEFQLVSAANGGFCGGGFHSAPQSSLDDGLLDISLIKKVSRLEFMRLVGPYKKGTHLDTTLGKQIVGYKKAKSVEFVFEKPTNVCIDGEVTKMDSLKLSIMPKSVSFVIPVGCRIKRA